MQSQEFLDTYFNGFYFGDFNNPDDRAKFLASDTAQAVDKLFRTPGADKVMLREVLQSLIFCLVSSALHYAPRIPVEEKESLINYPISGDSAGSITEWGMRSIQVDVTRGTCAKINFDGPVEWILQIASEYYELMLDRMIRFF